MIQKYTPVLINPGFKTESAVMIKSTCGEYIKYAVHVKHVDKLMEYNYKLQAKELESDQVIEGLTKENHFLKLDNEVLLRTNKLLADRVKRQEKELTIIGDKLNKTIAGNTYPYSLSKEDMEYLRNR